VPELRAVRYDYGMPRARARTLPVVIGLIALCGLVAGGAAFLRRDAPQRVAQGEQRIEEVRVPPSDATEQENDTLRVLFGEVVDDGHEPIAGATVQARFADGSIETRASDTDGAFTLDGFRSDLVRLTFSAPGFARAEVNGDALPRMREASWSQKLRRSSAPEDRALGIGGVVVDDTGAPVTAYRLVLAPRTGNDHDRRARSTVHHVVDKAGEFERTDVTEPVSLQVIAPKFRPATADAAPGDRVRIALVRSNALRGRVTDVVTGAPVVGASVSLDGMRTFPGAITDAEGRYAIETLPVEKVSVNVRAEGYLPLTLGGIEGGRSRDETLDAKLSPATAGVSTEVVGIGVSVGRHKDGVLVRGVFDVGPAHGVLDDGDVITEADGVSLAGRPLREGMAAIRGEPGTTVRLTVRKANGGEERVSLERARVAVPEG
jgi:hypothetical protein